MTIINNINGLLLSGILVASLCPSAQAAGISQTELIASGCYSCHGAQGRGSGKIPKLKGEDFNDLKETLQGLKTGAEKSTIMNHHAKAYTDVEIEALAKFFSQL